MSLNYYILDCETTGLRVGFQEVIQVSIIRCSDKFQITKNIKAEYPERASKEALQITGKTLADLKKGVSRLEAVEAINKFLDEDEKLPEARCMVAHNYSFDQRYMHALWDSVQMKFPADLWMCTKEFSRKLADKLGIVKPKLTLAACVQMAGLPERPGAHSASIDVLNTFGLWEKLMTQNLNHISVIKNKPHNFDKAAIANYDF